MIAEGNYSSSGPATSESTAAWSGWAAESLRCGPHQALPPRCDVLLLRRVCSRSAAHILKGGEGADQRLKGGRYPPAPVFGVTVPQPLFQPPVTAVATAFATPCPPPPQAHPYVGGAGVRAPANCVAETVIVLSAAVPGLWQMTCSGALGPCLPGAPPGTPRPQSHRAGHWSRLGPSHSKSISSASPQTWPHQRSDTRSSRDSQCAPPEGALQGSGYSEGTSSAEHVRARLLGLGHQLRSREVLQRNEYQYQL